MGAPPSDGCALSITFTRQWLEQAACRRCASAEHACTDWAVAVGCLLADDVPRKHHVWLARAPSACYSRRRLGQLLVKSVAAGRVAMQLTGHAGSHARNDAEVIPEATLTGRDRYTGGQTGVRQRAAMRAENGERARSAPHCTDDQLCREAAPVKLSIGAPTCRQQLAGGGLVGTGPRATKRAAIRPHAAGTETPSERVLLWFRCMLSMTRVVRNAC